MSSEREMTLKEICDRYRSVFVPAVADVLDQRDLWNQTMHRDIQGITMGMRVAGPAFTIVGLPERRTDKSIRKGAEVMDYIGPHQVAVMTTGGDTRAGHWGELLSNAARARGATGAVVDGGLRDTSRVIQMGFPVFCRFRCPADARGRFNVVDMEEPVVCGDVLVHPGDFIVGDSDGVVVVPRELAIEVLLEAERWVASEDEIRHRVQAGESAGELYMEYEQF